jgi:hypothetical protein
MDMIFFNTHRPYTDSGQRIRAYHYKGEYKNKSFSGVVFRDCSRGIAGYIRGCKLNQLEIMQCYDAGEYEALCTGDSLLDPLDKTMRYQVKTSMGEYNVEGLVSLTFREILDLCGHKWLDDNPIWINGYKVLKRDSLDSSLSAHYYPER